MIPTTIHFRFVLKWLLYIASGCGAIFLSTLLYIFTQFGGTAATGAECAIIFGAAVHHTDTAGPGIQRRVATAVDLYKAGRVERLFFSGAKGSEGQASESSVMRGFAMLQGAEPEDIIIEEESTSTWENLLYTKPLMEDCKTVIAVSDRYHLARIGLLADLQNWDNLETYPAEQTAPWYFELRSSVREAAAYLYYVVRNLALVSGL